MHLPEFPPDSLCDQKFSTHTWTSWSLGLIDSIMLRGWYGRRAMISCRGTNRLSSKPRYKSPLCSDGADNSIRTSDGTSCVELTVAKKRNSESTHFIFFDFFMFVSVCATTILCQYILNLFIYSYISTDASHFSRHTTAALILVDMGTTLDKNDNIKRVIDNEVGKLPIYQTSIAINLAIAIVTIFIIFNGPRVGCWRKHI